jgi:rod shape-determining protein MreB and related proteins
MFTTDLYVRVGINRFRIRNISSGANIEKISKTSFSHERMLIGSFTEAQALLKSAVAEVKGPGFLKSLRLVMHPTEVLNGGLSQVEERVLLELGRGTGTRKVVIWVGMELNDEAVKAKLQQK